MRIVLIIFLYFLIPFIGFSQNVSETRTEILIRLHKELKMTTVDTMRIYIWNDLAGYYQFTRGDSGIYYATKALVLSRELTYVTGELDALQLLGLSYRTIGDYSKALRIDVEGLRKAKTYNLKRMEALFVVGLGRDYYLAGDKKASLIFYRRAHTIFQSLNDANFISISGALLGRAYFALDELDSAFKFIYRAKKLAHSINLGWVSRISYSRLAYIHSSLGTTDSALYYYKKSILVSQSSKSGQSNYLLEIAKLYQTQEQKDSTIFYAKRALEIGLKNRLFGNIINASLFLTDFYENTDAAKALDYNKIAYAFQDSISEMAKMSAFTDFKDFDEQQRQYEIEADKKESQSRIRTNAFLGSTFTLLIIAFFLYRNNRTKQRAKQKIEKAYDQLKATQTQLIHSEKMASLGELTAGIAHEIQNPLNFVNNFSDVNKELILELNEAHAKGDKEEVEAITKDILENEEKVAHHGKRAEGIVKSMLQHSRGSDGQKEPTDINALADEYLRLAYHGFRAKDKSFNADFKTDFDEALPKINVVPQDIGRVLLNLINNAFFAVNERSKSSGSAYLPTVTVITNNLPLTPSKGGQQSIEISITDNGSGIPDSIKEKIFQPFFTTKPTGQGTGLGLSLSYDIITKGHGGALKMETEKGKGSEFVVELPIA